MIITTKSMRLVLFRMMIFNQHSMIKITKKNSGNLSILDQHIGTILNFRLIDYNVWVIHFMKFVLPV